MIPALAAVVLVLLIGWRDLRDSVIAWLAKWDGDADERAPAMRQYRRRHGRRVKW